MSGSAYKLSQPQKCFWNVTFYICFHMQILFHHPPVQWIWSIFLNKCTGACDWIFIFQISNIKPSKHRNKPDNGRVCVPAYFVGGPYASSALVKGLWQLSNHHWLLLYLWKQCIMSNKNIYQVNSSQIACCKDCTRGLPATSEMGMDGIISGFVMATDHYHCLTIPLCVVVSLPFSCPLVQTQWG